jgi:hypothetical protein
MHLLSFQLTFKVLMFFRSLAIEAFHPLSLWQTLALIALRDSIFRMFASYFRCAEFFKDTIGLEEMVVVAGKNSYLSLFQNVLITVECQSLPIDISLSLFYPFGVLCLCIVQEWPSHNPLSSYSGFGFLLSYINYSNSLSP